MFVISIYNYSTPFSPNTNTLIIILLTCIQYIDQLLNRMNDELVTKIKLTIALFSRKLKFKNVLH